MSAQPAPFTSADCDLRGYEWMPLFGARLFASNFEAHASDLAFRIAIKLYWECWQQVPAASLPNDDVQLCRLAGLGRDLKTWRKLRADGVLHGFVLCSDDRLYHGLLADEALKAWEARKRQQAERDYERDKKRRQRARHTNGDGRDFHPDVPLDMKRCPQGQTQMSSGTSTVTNAGVLRDVPPRARTLTGQVQDKREERKEDFLKLTSFCTLNSAREAAEQQEPDEPEPTVIDIADRRQAFREELEKQAPDIAAHVRRAANAYRMPIPYGEVRSREAQIAALQEQPRAVGADVTMGQRWQPAEPVNSIEAQIAAARAGCSEEQIAKAAAYATRTVA